MNAKDVASSISLLFYDILSEFMLHPDSLKVCVTTCDRTVIVTILAAGRDVGRVIGEKGVHFNALKIIGAMIGLKTGFAVELEPVPDPIDPGKTERYEKFRAREDWPKREIVGLLERTARAVFRAEASVEVVCEDLSDATSLVTVMVAGSEPAGLIDPVEQSLKALFNAVGKANGRTILVGVTPCKQADPPQPKTAAGRNARELRR